MRTTLEANDFKQRAGPTIFFFLLSQDACTFLEVWIFYGFKNSTGLTSETKIPTG